MSESEMSSKSEETAELRRLLLLTKDHCERSDETGYSHLTTGEVIYQLQLAVDCLDEGRGPDFETFDLLFAPTGSLQDIAIDNGWGEEFLILAKEYEFASRKENRN